MGTGEALLLPSGAITNCTGTFAGATAAPSVVGTPPPPIKSMGLKYNEGKDDGLFPSLSFALLSTGNVAAAGTDTLAGADALVAAGLGKDFVIVSNVGVNREGSLLFVSATGAAVGFSIGVGSINCGKYDPRPESFGGGLETPSSKSGAVVVAGGI